ncbi:MAG: DUF1552 domain-containing protein [Myxococcota bacterium]
MALTGPLSRRQLLVGASGATLALPFLPSLLPKAARGQDDPPLRFMAIIDRYGQFPQHWDDQMEATNPAGEHILTRRLTDINGPINAVIDGRFDDLRSKMTVVQGLDVLVIPGHNRSAPLCASKADARMDSGPPDFGYSIDTILEESAVGQNSVVPALRICPGRGGRYDRGISYSWNTIGGEVTNLPIKHSDVDTFDELFGQTQAPDTGLSPAERQALVIDRVLPEYNALMADRRIGRADQQRLDQHVTALRDVQTRIQAGQALTCDDPGVLRPAENDTRNWYYNFMDMAVLAFACQMTNICVINVNHFKTTIDDHNRSEWHGGTHDLEDSSAARKLPEVEFEATLVSYLLHAMDGVTEANGKTILDNSITLWSNEQARGIHQLYSMPVVVAGGGGKLNTDLLIDYRQRPFRYTANRRDFGAVGRPYNELLITIMQAMGLGPEDYRREGRDGFGDYIAPYRNLDYWESYLTNKNTPLPVLSNFA